MGAATDELFRTAPADAAAFVAADDPADARAYDAEPSRCRRCPRSRRRADAEATRQTCYTNSQTHIKEPPRRREEERVAEHVLDRGIQRPALLAGSMSRYR